MPNELSPAYRHLELQNQLWLNQRVAWIVREFGLETLKRIECVLPTSRRVVEYRGGTDSEVIAYFQLIARDVGLEPAEIEFSIEDQLQTDEGTSALGLYSEREEGRFSIAIAAQQLSDPCELLSTLVHELCHIHLLGHRRIDEQADDHEPLTDLLCVFMGYGIISANSVVYDRTEGVGAYRQWRMRRQGYLSMSMFGYALALLARLRNEDGQAWRRHMRADVRDAFDHSLRFFHRHGLPDLSNVPAEFVEPLLTLEPTPFQPPTNALAPLYADSEDHEIPEEETDYPAQQRDTAEASDEQVIDATGASKAPDDEAGCVYCGATDNLRNLVLPAIGESRVCGACYESMDESDRETAELAPADQLVGRLISYALIGSFAFMALIILWSMVTAIWND